MMTTNNRHRSMAIIAIILLTILSSPNLCAAPDLVYEGTVTIEAVIPEKRTLIISDTPVILDASTEIVDADGHPATIDRLEPGTKVKIYYPRNGEFENRPPRKIVIGTD